MTNHPTESEKDEKMENGANGNGKPIDIGKQRWIVTPQFLWSLVVIVVFLLYTAIQGTIFLNTISQYIKDLTKAVVSVVNSYQSQNYHYQHFQADATAKMLCIAQWEAKHRSQPQLNLDERCDRRIAILSDGTSGDVEFDTQN